jgi:hypothetical protein
LTHANFYSKARSRFQHLSLQVYQGLSRRGAKQAGISLLEDFTESEIEKESLSKGVDLSGASLFDLLNRPHCGYPKGPRIYWAAGKDAVLSVSHNRTLQRSFTDGI